MSTTVDPETLPGYRRRIAIEPSAGSVTAELEDDFHRMVVTLKHEQGVITGAQSQMKRSPWTTCEGAMAQLDATFVGKALDDPSVKATKTLNCTHLYDLATFCAGHAGLDERVVYDIFVSDPIEGRIAARLYRNGERLFDWALEGGKFVSPQEIAGQGLLEIGAWLNGLAGYRAEAARVLRWATMIAGGRMIDMPAGMSGTALARGAPCHTFQPGIAELARRKPGADVDFSLPGEAPMADREELFARG